MIVNSTRSKSFYVKIFPMRMKKFSLVGCIKLSITIPIEEVKDIKK